MVFRDDEKVKTSDSDTGEHAEKKRVDRQDGAEGSPLECNREEALADGYKYSSQKHREGHIP